MAIKESELYSSLWSSCDELRGRMDASQFATESGKSKGQFYTHAEVSRIMAQIIFIGDASAGFQKDGPKNRMPEQGIHQIIDVFTRRLEIPCFRRKSIGDIWPSC